MRISDWSSDVCSSDLRVRRTSRLEPEGARQRARPLHRARSGNDIIWAIHFSRRIIRRFAMLLARQAGREADLRSGRFFHGGLDNCRSMDILTPIGIGGSRRSEEQTSELQSLMRISSAVFSLTK